MWEGVYTEGGLDLGMGLGVSERFQGEDEDGVGESGGVVPR